MAGQDGWFGPDQYTNLANPSAHYRTTGPEVWMQTAGRVTHFVASLGTCGTVTGTGTYLKQQNPSVTIVAAHPPEGHDIPGVRSKQQAQVTEHFRPELYDTLVEVSNEEAFEMCRQLNQQDGLIAGPSSGLNLQGALKTIPDEPGVCAVVIFCDDIWKYTASCAKHLPGTFGEREQVAVTPENKKLNQILEVARTGPDSLTGKQARQFLEESNPVLLDVRPPDQYEMSLRAEGAKSAPLADLMEDAVSADTLPADTSTPVLLYCNRGVDSLFAMTLLKSKGYTHVKHVLGDEGLGGMFEWWRAGLATENVEGPLPAPKTEPEQLTVELYDNFK